LVNIGVDLFGQTCSPPHLVSMLAWMLPRRESSLLQDDRLA
jgi:hypothetical protein